MSQNHVTHALTVTEVKIDDSGSFIRFIDDGGEEGFLLLPTFDNFFSTLYNKNITIQVEDVAEPTN
jgi:hypothetical protein